ncbi:hypothetical protein COU89_00890 [Candidatus Roizmanbacteria bacterium CG10_big_fil_rev_8_21_14_0_10_45_7]|uniref:Polymerase nucleotidyl transferase domain-containing protein n=1 Tax=Candidatus Roizmanbacteria bacterium CG10_big_fil_rev_8_21_14_0_10_45_7 TaxID=1974854 RepID=A0A2M8KVE7_9BACT|nr:MAG: hypothetical protein COU89_00890 [Candidatus Roizmanbacteria bacterium CG10_big_fil_rev_8_21_14_0_10_45_7]
MENRGLEDVFRYFAFFQYAPSIEQIHTFYPKKISRAQLERLLTKEIGNKKLPYFLKSQRRVKEAAKKVNLVKNYVRLLSYIFCIQMVAVSGSIAVGNAKPNDDIDLFLVTKSGYLWTSRFIAVLLAYVMGLKRKRGVIHAPNKVCLNLFFDETDLALPKYKRNLYTAHEVLQVVPMVNKNHTYEQFMAKNNWVSSFFPNAAIPTVKKKSKKLTTHIGVIEMMLKKIQLWIMNPHRTTEIITDTQLWFLPRDMEKKLRGRL